LTDKETPVIPTMTTTARLMTPTPTMTTTAFWMMGMATRIRLLARRHALAARYRVAMTTAKEL
jgi:hypothetical protein